MVKVYPVMLTDPIEVDEAEAESMARQGLLRDEPAAAPAAKNDTKETSK